MARRVYGSPALVSEEHVNALDYEGRVAGQRNSRLRTARKFVDDAIEHARRQTNPG
jgi:hypothetical protein